MLCVTLKKIYMDRRSENDMDVNTAAVASTYHDTIADGWQETAQRGCKVGIEEARKRGHVDEDGTPLLTVVTSDCWSKLSYCTNYNSLSGAAIVGFYTRKVLFISVKNKYCTICLHTERNNEVHK
ncbi:hypothetical protein PR048_021008 [Dryococelus australis]|uniref:Mutator-like transposase domain-containing protein n=1 Tax=Dryococelus australis TaxID=614101 RepID=A0ABQ9GX27_9NEOP|nr:hypothetical protein PR048_021008 [Dryococelus australis]